MTVVNHDTGELVETIGEREARDAIVEATNEFKSSVAHFERGWGIILDALDRGAHIALGYRSPSDLLAHEFDGYLNALDVAHRRLVVRELTIRGASSRAIAPVVGVSQPMVVKDIAATGDNSVITPHSPAPEEGEADGAGPHVSAAADEPEGEDAPAATVEPGVDQESAPPRPPVIGIDGKTYAKAKPKKPVRKPLADAFFRTAYDLGKKAESLHRLIEDDRWPQNAEKVATAHRNDLLGIRDLLEQVINAMPEQESTT